MTTTETKNQTPTQPTTSPPVSKGQLAPIAAIKDGLEKMRPQFTAVLPGHITPQRFERIALTAVNANPDLLDADRRSLFQAFVLAATDGLLPDKREGAVVVFKDKSGRKVATWMPMVFGLMKKIRQSGEIDSIGARIVYQKEIDDGRFRYVIENGEEKLFHDPMLYGERGDKVLVYAYARFKESGHVEYAPLHRNDVMKRRNVSRAKDSGPWRDWEDEMWLKTAVRSIAKRLPLSADLLSAIERDETPTHFDELRAAAMAQLGGGAVGVLESKPIEPEIVEDESDVAERTIANGINYIANETFPNEEEMDEFTEHMRSSVHAFNISDELTSRLIGELNAAQLERKRKLQKSK